MNRKQALEIAKTLTNEQRDAIALIIETADVQGDYCFNGEDSVWEDSAQGTLNALAYEIRNTN